MADFDIKEFDEKVSASIVAMKQEIEMLKQAVVAANEQLKVVCAENCNLNGRLSEKDQTVSIMEEDISNLQQKIVERDTELKNLRREKSNQKSDINDLRKQKKDLEDLLTKMYGDLENMRIMTIEQVDDQILFEVSDDELRRQIPESEKGKHKGVLIHTKEINNDRSPRFFQRLSAATPEIDWGLDPIVAKEGQTIFIPPETTIVAFLCWGMTHSLEATVRNTAKLNGSHVISGNKIGQMVSQIRIWLANPDFGKTKSPYPIIRGRG